jgi:hypothetical protein
VRRQAGEAAITGHRQAVPPVRRQVFDPVPGEAQGVVANGTAHARAPPHTHTAAHEGFVVDCSFVCFGGRVGV